MYTIFKFQFQFITIILNNNYIIWLWLQKRVFLSLNLGLQNENENWENTNSCENVQECNFWFVSGLVFSKKRLFISTNFLKFLSQGFLWKSHFQDMNIFLSISRFKEKKITSQGRARKMKLILTRIFENENWESLLCSVNIITVIISTTIIMIMIIMSHTDFHDNK